jgi:hypothetical protein
LMMLCSTQASETSVSRWRSTRLQQLHTILRNSFFTLDVSKV